MNNSLKSISFEDINKDRKKYAKEFSEGNKDLEECLLMLWNNDLYTRGCCIGHGKTRPYVGIDLNINPQRIINLLNNIEKNDIRISFIRGENNKNLSIKSKNIEDLSIFKKIINSLNKKETKNNFFNEDFNKINDLTSGYYSIVYYFSNNNVIKKIIITDNREEIIKLKDKYEYIVLNEKNNLYQFKLM